MHTCNTCMHAYLCITRALCAVPGVRVAASESRSVWCALAFPKLRLRAASLRSHAAHAGRLSVLSARDMLPLAGAAIETRFVCVCVCVLKRAQCT